VPGGTETCRVLGVLKQVWFWKEMSISYRCC